LAVIVMAAGAFAQGKPKIAVYVKGGMGDEVKTAFRNELLFALVKSERYSAVDNNDAFVAVVKREMERHGVSEMSDMQIGKAGEHVNADFVCVANVSPLLGGYQTFARVIDVKNEAVAEMGRGAGAIASAADVARIAGEIVKSMFAVSGEAAPPVQAAVPAQQVMPAQQAPAVTPPLAYTPAPPMETPAPQPTGPVKAAVHVTGIASMQGIAMLLQVSEALIKSRVYAEIKYIDVSVPPSVPALADAGRNAGVSYIFAINLTGQISVAIIDVAGSMELAKTTIDGKITGLSAANTVKKIVDFILTSGPKPDPETQAQYAGATRKEDREQLKAIAQASMQATNAAKRDNLAFLLLRVVDSATNAQIEDAKRGNRYFGLRYGTSGFDTRHRIDYDDARYGIGGDNEMSIGLVYSWKVLTSKYWHPTLLITYVKYNYNVEGYSTGSDLEIFLSPLGWRVGDGPVSLYLLGLGAGSGYGNGSGETSLYFGAGLLNGIELNVQDFTFGIDYHLMLRREKNGGGYDHHTFGFSVKYRY